MSRADATGRCQRKHGRAATRNQLTCTVAPETNANDRKENEDT